MVDGHPPRKSGEITTEEKVKEQANLRSTPNLVRLITRFTLQTLRIYDLINTIIITGKLSITVSDGRTKFQKEGKSRCKISLIHY